VPNFIEIDQTAAEINDFGDLTIFKKRPTTTLNF